MTRDFDKERAHYTFYKMIQIDRLHRGIFEKMNAAIGIHRSQHRLLMYVARKDGCPSQKEIAEHFDISPAAVAVSLKKLEDHGFITRENHEQDNRFNIITLTARGKKIVEKSEAFFAESDFSMFKDFTEDDYENLTCCLEKMMSGLKEFTASPDSFVFAE